MSYCKIFTVVNEHTVSAVTARYAIALAVACKAELVLYATHDKKCNATTLQHVERHLDHLFTAATELDIPVTRMVETGDVSKLLPERVQAEKGDLVFYPLTPYKHHGTDPQRHTVHQLMGTVGSDLAIMRTISMAKPHPRHILVPLGKVVSDMERRLLFIAELANCFHSQVTLFHLFDERGGNVVPEDITMFRKQLEQKQVKTLERSGRGHVAKSIIVEAITRHNDLVVLGASRRGVLQKLFLGNPADDILQQPPCNTILFRAAIGMP